MNGRESFFYRFAGFNNTINRYVNIFHLTPHRWFVRSIISRNMKIVKKKAA